eukprot:CAMPEP_0114537334 /NCGR_PEP_ID=MMETSP0109-20121206/29526_1 /TAXON_ID=29199 /ORGANISM="Chlorarachnion reptans, Strain CCCM449" /LENGTH=128 /DNA_ID=CAMNT_0001721223 /DNA_START=550 /DNA_END=933 /DNA_ORIENTATION=+
MKLWRRRRFASDCEQLSPPHNFAPAKLFSPANDEAPEEGEKARRREEEQDRLKSEVVVSRLRTSLPRLCPPLSLSSPTIPTTIPSSSPPEWEKIRGRERPPRARPVRGVGRPEPELMGGNKGCGKGGW